MKEPYVGVVALLLKRTKLFSAVSFSHYEVVAFLRPRIDFLSLLPGATMGRQMPIVQTH